MKKSEALLEVERLEKTGRLKEQIGEWEIKLERELEKAKKEGLSPFSEPIRNLESKLSWSRMTPEEREREVEFWEWRKKKEDKINKEIKEIEYKLTPKQIELRKKAVDFADYCSSNLNIHATSKEEAKRIEDEITEKAIGMLKDALKQVKSAEEIKPLLRKEEWEKFYKYHRTYKISGFPIYFWVTYFPKPTKEQLEEAKRRHK